jgi:hypothetical protein
MISSTAAITINISSGSYLACIKFLTTSVVFQIAVAKINRMASVGENTNPTSKLNDKRRSKLNSILP